MPCDTIQTSEVEVLKLNDKIANDALLRINRGDAYYKMGKLHFRGELDVNEFKRAYSAIVVERNAQRLGWTLKKTGENKYAVSKRF